MLAVHDLAALVAVAESGSVRRAAATLGRTQPAVSQAIARLEEAVGFALLDRSGYRVRLTERGETFVKRARANVKQARDLSAFATVLSRGVEARLRIAVHGSIPAEAWMHLIEDVAARFPETVLEIRAGEGDGPVRCLIRDEADLAVALGGAPVRHAAAVIGRPLGQLEFVNVVRSSRLGSHLDDDLDPLPQILVADFEDPAAAYFVAEGHRYWRVSDHRIKAAAILAGAGWGCVPVSLVEPALKDGTLSPISYRGAASRSSQTYSLLRRSDAPQGPVAAFIWDRCDPDAAR